jgi:hypothetical protein
VIFMAANEGIYRDNMVVREGDSWLDVGLPYSHAGGDDYVDPIQNRI